MRLVGLLAFLAIMVVIIGVGSILQKHLAKRRDILESEQGKALREAREQLRDLQYADWRVRQVDSYVREQVVIHGETLDNAMLLSIINRKPTVQEIEGYKS